MADLQALGLSELRAMHDAGKEIAASPGVKLMAMKDGHAVLELAAGTYHFLSR